MYTAVGRYQIKNTNALIETRRKIQKNMSKNENLKVSLVIHKVFQYKVAPQRHWTIY